MKTLILLFSVLFTTMSFAQVPSYVPANGLVGWWPFNGNANDESGNGNNGTVNGATLTSDRNGVANQAYSFDGSSSIVVSTPSFTFIENQDFSLSCFVYITPQSISGSFVAYGDFQTGNYVWHIGQNNSIMQWGVAIQQYFWSSVDLPSNQVFPNLNSWYHLVGVKINGVISLYVNGVIVGSVNQVIGGALTTNLPLTFGWFTGTGQYMHGSLDDIGIWNRALTECEIQNLYNSTNPTNTTTASACNSYTWNGTTYTASGVYTDTSNCVTESLNLTITPSSTITQPASQSINISNNVQFIVGSSGSNSIYQWQTNLGFGFQNLNNAGQYNGTTSSTLSITNLSMSNNNQVFRCIISSGSCTDTSDVAVLTVVNNVGFNDLSASKLSIYPNPTNGDFTITGLELVGSVSSLTLTDMNGKVVKVFDTKGTKFSMASIKPGVYFLNIISGNKEEVLKIVKE